MTQTITQTQPRFIVPRKVRMSPDAPSITAFRWMFGQLVRGRDLTGKVEVRHEGRCGRCGRLLTVPESIDSGIGPVCAEKMGGAAGVPRLESDPLPFILAGNATITITSVRTGQSYTYRVRRGESRNGRPAPWFVSVLTGPGNTSDYTWMGMIFPGEEDA